MAWVDLPSPTFQSWPKKEKEALTNLTSTRPLIGEIAFEWQLERESTHDPSSLYSEKKSSTYFSALRHRKKFAIFNCILNSLTYIQVFIIFVC